MNSECFLDVLDTLLLKVLELVLLEVEMDLSTTTNGRVDGVRSGSESATGSRLLDVLLVVVVLRQQGTRE